MDDKLIYQIKLLKQYIDILERIKPESKERFIKDDILHGAAERYLQLAIESCINIGNRILSIEQFNHNITPPETYSDIFKNLAVIGIIDDKLSERLVNMARFRNKLVHVYWEIDHGFIYDLLINNLSDIVSFMSITANNGVVSDTNFGKKEFAPQSATYTSEGYIGQSAQPIQIITVVANNNEVIVTLSGVPSPPPAAGNFMVMASVNGGPPMPSKIDSLSWDRVASQVTMRISGAVRGDSNQKVVAFVSYNGGPTVASL